MENNRGQSEISTMIPQETHVDDSYMTLV